MGIEPVSDLESDLALALSLADAADRITMARFQASDLVVMSKPDLTPVTEADQAVERHARGQLALDRPGDSLLGEEFGGVLASTGRQWIIDPIDATKNYVRGVPVWATLIALAEQGQAVVGVASAPALGRRWWAARGLGAFRSQIGLAGSASASRAPVPLAVSQVANLADASFSFSDPVGWPGDALAELMGAVWRVRAYGDFWSHLMVAEGGVDIAAEPELSVWDFAALLPIVTEAGGTMTGFDGATGLSARSAITTNGLLDGQVREVIERHL
jgi:histidinol-phosphatase